MIPRILSLFLAAAVVLAVPDARAVAKGHNRQERLENTRWVPARIGDRPVVVSGRQREPWIELNPKSKRVAGSGGCNRIAGTYEAGPGTLRFGPLISTKMACPGVDMEAPFLRALHEVRAYRVHGRVLELMDDRGQLLARLDERNLR